MNSKHLATGAQCPPLENGKLRIYSMRLCPYAQRALLVAEAKNIPHDVVNCNLKAKPEFLLEKNPLGKVPTTEDSNGILYESLIVCDYLDENFPGRKMTSEIPYQKALDKIWIGLFDNVITLFYNCLQVIGCEAVDDNEAKRAITELSNSLLTFEKELVRRGTQYFAGNESPGMLDYMIWPWMERLPSIKVFYPSEVGDVGKEIPNLMKWCREMRKDKAVEYTFLEANVHYQYRKSWLDGAPNYDVFLE